MSSFCNSNAKASNTTNASPCKGIINMFINNYSQAVVLCQRLLLSNICERNSCISGSLFASTSIRTKSCHICALFCDATTINIFCESSFCESTSAYTICFADVAKDFKIIRDHDGVYIGMFFVIIFLFFLFICTPLWLFMEFKITSSRRPVAAIKYPSHIVNAVDVLFQDGIVMPADDLAPSQELAHRGGDVPICTAQAHRGDLKLNAEDVEFGDEDYGVSQYFSNDVQPKLGSSLHVVQPDSLQLIHGGCYVVCKSHRYLSAGVSSQHSATQVNAQEFGAAFKAPILHTVSPSKPQQGAIFKRAFSTYSAARLSLHCRGVLRNMVFPSFMVFPCLNVSHCSLVRYLNIFILYAAANCNVVISDM
jgi:hypothetical protein